MKGGADGRVKSSGVPAGYVGDVLKGTETREGKGMQSFTNGTVLDGWFYQDKFVKGRMIDCKGNKLQGNF